MLVISFCVLGLEMVTFLDMGLTDLPPLNILVNHWREVRERGKNLSVVIKNGKLIILCFSQWPTFIVWWPSIGNFDLQVIKAVGERVFRPGSLRLSDQVPYIVTWKDTRDLLLIDPPPSYPPLSWPHQCQHQPWDPQPIWDQGHCSPLYRGE